MKRKLLIIIPVALIGLAGTAFILEKTGVTNFYQANTPDDIPAAAPPESKIDYSPAKPTDNDEINQKKENGFDEPSPSPSQTAYVTITRASVNNGTVDISALLSGVSDGTCTATLTQGSTVITSTAAVKKQDQYVYCDTFNFNGSQVSEGKWQVTVSVQSADGTITGSGNSEMQV